MPISKPPSVDGLMNLTEEQKQAIKAKLVAIQTSFDPTDQQPVCDTFYLVSTYNKQNVGAEINGDTAESILN